MSDGSSFNWLLSNVLTRNRKRALLTTLYELKMVRMHNGYALDSGSAGPGSSPGRGHCVVFLGKILYSHSASLHPGVQMGTSKCAGGNPAMD